MSKSENRNTDVRFGAFHQRGRDKAGFETQCWSVSALTILVYLN